MSYRKPAAFDRKKKHVFVSFGGDNIKMPVPMCRQSFEHNLNESSDKNRPIRSIEFQPCTMYIYVFVAIVCVNRATPLKLVAKWNTRTHTNRAWIDRRPSWALYLPIYYYYYYISASVSLWILWPHYLIAHRKYMWPKSIDKMGNNNNNSQLRHMFQSMHYIKKKLLLFLRENKKLRAKCKIHITLFLCWYTRALGHASISSQHAWAMFMSFICVYVECCRSGCDLLFRDHRILWLICVLCRLIQLCIVRMRNRLRSDSKYAPSIINYLSRAE